MSVSYAFRAAPSNPNENASDQQTYFSGLNNSLQLVGNYAVGATTVAFVYSSAAPGGFVAVAPAFASAYATGINGAGAVVGIGQASADGPWQGFLSANGAVASFTYPGAAGTSPTALNDAGFIVGSYTDADGANHGFSYSAGVFATLDPPAANLSNINLTGVNNSNQIVGYAYNADTFAIESFIKADNRFTTMADPTGAGLVVATAINNNGVVAGFYGDLKGFHHGFVYRNGHYRTVDRAGAAETFIYGVNDHGDLVGEAYFAATDSYADFVAQAQQRRAISFSGDAVADLLWRNDDGLTALWTNNGSGGFAGRNLGRIDPAWKIAGTGDFNGDGFSDILWRNESGRVSLWCSDTAGGFASQDLGIVDASWRIAGTGDFNGDGFCDLLWRSADGGLSTWASNGAGAFTSRDLGAVDASWRIEGTGDFNNDGCFDILWRNDGGLTSIWSADGVGGFASQSFGAIGQDWTVGGIGDLNGDGSADILWRNVSGQTEVWNSDGAGGFAGKALGVIDKAWTVAQLGDLNGDGFADILWRNASGQTEAWNSNGTGGFAGQALALVGTDWKVVS